MICLHCFQFFGYCLFCKSLFDISIIKVERGRLYILQLWVRNCAKIILFKKCKKCLLPNCLFLSFLKSNIFNDFILFFFVFFPQPSVQPTKYHYYPHNQHPYFLPECAIQQVRNYCLYIS